MKGPLLRSHVLAAAYGLIFALFCGFVAGALQPFPFLIIFMMFPGGLMWGLLFYTIPTCLGIVLARWLAKRLGAYDIFAILAGVLALALSFGFDYASSIRSWLTSTGEVHGTILGPGPPPEAIGGWIFRGLSLAVWIGLMIGVGIAWKRSREREAPPDALTPAEISKMFLWMFLDAIVVGGLTFAILRADLQQRRVFSSPQNVFDREAAVLNDKEASAGDRALALNAIEGTRDSRTTDLLRRAVQEETGETQLTAAANLIGRDDLLALSVLEGPLMQSSRITGTLLPTTSHTPSNGNGVRVAGFSQSINLGTYLNRVKDPAAAPILARLMGSSDAGTREGAASALRTIMTLKARGGDRWVPAWPRTLDLSAVTNAMIAGLDDSDEMVRYFSVCTMMEINDNPHYPAVFLFKAHEEAYVNGWKAWAQNRTPAP